jgi:hypothetical protein
MHPERIEKLRQEYTDQYVVVDPGRPDLARFKGAVGRVATVNFNGRALVEFDLNNNRGRYDIELDYLKVVDKPEPKAPPAKPKPAAAKAKPAAAPKAKSGTSGPAKETPSTGKTGPPPLTEEKSKTEGGASALPKSPSSKPRAPGEEEDRESLSDLELARLEKAKAEKKQSAKAATDSTASSSEDRRDEQTPKADVSSDHGDS